LPSALARGSESRIYSHKVRMYVHAYVRGGSRSRMSCRMSLHTIGKAICASHSLTHSDMLDSDSHSNVLINQWNRSYIMQACNQHSFKINTDESAQPRNRSI